MRDVQVHGAIQIIDPLGPCRYANSAEHGSGAGRGRANRSGKSKASSCATSCSTSRASTARPSWRLVCAPSSCARSPRRRASCATCRRSGRAWAGLGWFDRLLTERRDPRALRQDQPEVRRHPAACRSRASARPACRHPRPARSPGSPPWAKPGTLSADVQDRLRAAFDHITGLQLRQQIADYEAGRAVSNFVDPADLTAREIDLLKDAFRAINDFRAHVRAELTSELI